LLKNAPFSDVASAVRPLGRSANRNSGHSSLEAQKVRQAHHHSLSESTGLQNRGNVDTERAVETQNNLHDDAQHEVNVQLQPTHNVASHQQVVPQVNPQPQVTADAPRTDDIDEDQAEIYELEALDSEDHQSETSRPELFRSQASGGLPNNQNIITERQASMQPEFRPSSSLSRPQSRDGHNKHSTKANHRDGSALRQQSESPFNNGTKISKPKPDQDHKECRKKTHSSAPQSLRPTSDAAKAYQKLLHYGQVYVDAMENYQEQKSLIDSQKKEIEKLNASSAESIMKIQTLEKEKGDLLKKTERCKKLAEKYKDHMNQVTEAQRELHTRHQRMVTIRTELREDRSKIEEDKKYLQHFADSFKLHERHIRRITEGIPDIKISGENLTQGKLSHV
jgi:hypothetical protein